MLTIQDTALSVAIKCHNGQENKYNGEPYLLHVQRVATSVREAGYSDLFVAVAWLHDTLEDTALNLEGLQAAFPGAHDLHSAVLALTHNKGESYADYCHRAKLNPIARIVKRFDLLDNFRRNHLIELEDVRLRMAKKYSMGLDILGALE